ncbi:MAG: hypothetical protein M1826_000446 [Phylliscum demangeonii]|nr:MAG: hypothetical protein M1826_000446 [Phylliscum demangeonii]
MAQDRSGAQKRTRDDVESDEKLGQPGPETADGQEDDVSSGDEDMGPQLPSASAPTKKRRKLPYEKLYLSNLPSSARYSKSLMHKEQLSFVTMTPHTDFLITSSTDGVVKFWKKIMDGIEFVKEFRAHVGEIRSVSVSADGRSFATAGLDKTVKLFDVITFDLLSMLSLDYTPRSLCWVHKRGASLPLLAVADDIEHVVHLYDGRGDQQKPLHSITALHRSPVSVMAYNDAFDCVVSADEGGTIEYWQPSANYEKPESVFEYKSSTSLFDLKKSKSVPVSITVSSSGSQFTTFSFPDRKIRIFDFASGRLYRTYDESLTTIAEMQQAGTALQQLDELDFGRRLAIERELETVAVRNKVNVIFDESGHFILYGSMLGVKVINTFTNRVVKVFGPDESLRSVNLCLYQGQPEKKGVVTVSMAASANPLLQEAEARDPMLVTTAVGKVRFYLFTNLDEYGRFSSLFSIFVAHQTDADDGGQSAQSGQHSIAKSERDIQNEKPRHLSTRARDEITKQSQSGTSALLHTTSGDIHIRLFPEAAPKAVENFVTHARNGYYNNTIFHRVIRKFMIQVSSTPREPFFLLARSLTLSTHKGGDPLGDGTGGESIWGREFEDEFSTLKQDKPYTVCMANAGPNTNGSQFFITTEKAPWLEGKHTIFGRAVQGLDVVHQIENVRTHKDRPEEDIKIVNISVSN